MPPPSFDITATVEKLRQSATVLTSTKRRRRPEVQLAFALDEKLKDQLPVVLQSISARLSRPARANILSRGLSADYFEELARDFPAFSFRVFACDDVDYGEGVRLLPHTTVSTMDRLLLPGLLNDVDKIVYLDIDIVVLGDVTELYDFDLGDRPLAGKSSIFPSWKYGHNLLDRITSTLPPDKASQLRRCMHAAGPLSFQGFNAGVLVLNLARMRADNFAQFAVPLVEGYDMNDQDALNFYARSNRGELPAEWNLVPHQEPIVNPKLIHFAGPVKPWDQLYVLESERYLKISRRYRERCAAHA
jgi:lipopolysaccharide biosynthesis glycosyltransferase